MNKEKELIDKLIDLAFSEDIGDGDHTTLLQQWENQNSSLKKPVYWRALKLLKRYFIVSISL